MKITKEVTISAAQNEIWAWITDETKLQHIWGAGTKADIRKNGRIVIPRSGQKWKVLAVKPPCRLSVNTGAPAKPIITAIELLAKGHRTSLKVTLSGWETIDPERARVEMPLVSLDWEKTLNLIKKAIETGAGGKSQR